MALKLLYELKTRTKAAILGLGAAALLLAPLSALAASYDSGPYGACAYSTGCPATPSSPTGGANGSTTGRTTTPPATNLILLNDFPDYFTAAGETLALGVGQVVYFDITVNGNTTRHSISVLMVGPDYVDIVIDNSPTSIRLSIGTTGHYDVSGDGQDDIQVNPKSVSGDTAMLNFRALGTNASPPTTSAPTTTTPSAHGFHLSWWLWLILFLLLFIIALWIFFLLWKRRKRDDNKRPPPTVIPPPGPPQT